MSIGGYLSGTIGRYWTTWLHSRFFFLVVVILLVAGVLFTLLGYVVIPYALGVLVRSPEVRAVGNAYLNYRLLGITSLAMTFSFKAFFDGIGKTHVHMIASVLMNVVIVVLCVIFIFGKFGSPHMGMAGAGLAGAVSSWNWSKARR